MNLSEFLLLLTPGLPLLLAIPWLRRFIPWCEYIVLLPAVVLVTLAEKSFVELPWLILGSGFGCDHGTRLLLTVAVLLWLMASFVSSRRVDSAVDGITSQRRTTFYFLTLSAYLATILATDIIAFFTFSTVLGYSFYALLVSAGGEAVKRAGRVYLCCIIVADLLLFDALLLVATGAQLLNFDVLPAVIAESSSASLYVWLVLSGFAFKAGIWPLYFWLPLAFRSARLPLAMLLAGVPVTAALLGIVRWLPLGDLHAPVDGLIIQGIGGAAVAYILVTASIWRESRNLPADLTIASTGLFLVIIGAGLSNPDVWQQFAHLAALFIGFLAIGLALLTAATGWSAAVEPASGARQEPLDATVLWFERCSRLLLQQSSVMAVQTLPRLRALSRRKIIRWLQIAAWKKTLLTAERTLLHWPVAIILLLLLGLTVVFLSMLFLH